MELFFFKLVVVQAITDFYILYEITLFSDAVTYKIAKLNCNGASSTVKIIITEQYTSVHPHREGILSLP